MHFKIRFTLAIIFSLFASMANANTPSIGPDASTLLSLKDQAEQHADFGAVVLSRINHVSINDELLESAIYYRAIYLTDEEAVSDYSKLINSYNGYYNDSTIDFARVITPDGTVYNMQKDAISEVNANSDDYLDDMKQVEFAIPQIKVGNIIEYQISESQIKPIIEGQYFSSLGFRYIKFLPQKNWLRIEPVLSTTNTLIVPKAVTLYFENRNTDIKPQVSDSSAHKTYTWTMEGLAGIEMENGMPPVDELQPVVYVSTMNDWEQVDSWYSKLFNPSLAQAQNVQTLAQTLFNGIDTDDKKVQAVFDYMQKNVRYIGAHVNRGGYQPHTAQEVLQNAYGDCKDQTTLIVALLREANIEAYPALVNTYSGSVQFENLPALNFNHMITYVPTENGGYWLDTSGLTGTFPGVSAGLAGKQTFIVNDESGELITIPEVSPEDNIANVKVTYRINEDKIGASVSLSFEGQVETNLRNYYKYSPEKRIVTEQLTSVFVHDNRFTSYEFSDPSDTATPFTIDAEFDDLITVDESIETFHYSMNYASIIHVFTSLSSLEPPKDRTQSLYLDIPITVNLDVVFPSPWEAAKLSYEGIAKNYQNPFFEMVHEATTSDEIVTSHAKFVLYSQTVEVSDYANFYEAIIGFQEENESIFVFEKQALANKSQGELSLEEKILQARDLLDNAEFESAQEYLITLAESVPDNGEVQFLLGIAHGFSGNDDKSSAAFERAQSLGYEF